MPPIGKLTRSTSLVVILSALALTLSACGTAGSQADGNKSEVGPGVTDTTIKVGFITRKASTAAGGGGFKTPAQGDVNAQVNALVEYINKNGGLGGRKITSVLKEYDSSAASVQKENDYCTAFTQDEKVFQRPVTKMRRRSCWMQGLLHKARPFTTPSSPSTGLLASPPSSPTPAP